MKVNNQNTTNTIITGVSILIASLGLFLVGRAIVKKIKRKKELEQAQLLQDSVTGGGNTQQQQIEQSQSTYNPSNDIKLLEDYIVGANLYTYADEVNGIIMKLNNVDLKKLADAWSKKYNGETLYYWLDDEWDSCGGFGLSNCYEPAMNRLSALGLR